MPTTGLHPPHWDTDGGGPVTAEPLFDVFPHAGEPVWPDRPRYLLSYAYLSDPQVDLCRDYGFDLAMDSGAFTTHASGKHMDHDGYLDWLAGNHDVVSFALSLDVIGDHHQSRVNHDHALDRVGDLVDMVPTFHLGSPLTELERMCDTYRFVAIGGAVPYAKQQRSLLNAFKVIHRIAAARGTKLHGLGMTGNRIIHGFPWGSVDSSAWLTPARFPTLPLADEEGRLVVMEHGWQLTRAERDLVAHYGGDPAIVATPGWCLSGDHQEPGIAVQRRSWVLEATARSYMYVEASKVANQPDHPIRVYLAGNVGGLVEGAVGAIHRAHQAGTPYPTSEGTAA